MAEMDAQWTPPDGCPHRVAPRREGAPRRRAARHHARAAPHASAHSTQQVHQPGRPGRPVPPPPVAAGVPAVAQGASAAARPSPPGHGARRQGGFARDAAVIPATVPPAARSVAQARTRGPKRSAPACATSAAACRRGLGAARPLHPDCRAARRFARAALPGGPAAAAPTRSQAVIICIF
jgi:hypothetical protein